MRKTVSIIGAGNVGASLAQLIAHSSLSDVVLFDIVDGMSEGKALDIQEACPLWDSSVKIKGTSDYEDTKGSDVIVITAGLARKPGMSRDDLLHANAGILSVVSREVSAFSPDSIIIVVTNPMDVMAYLVWKETGFDSRKVMGMGGVLDSSRLRTFIALELGVSPSDVEAVVLGGHGDQMAPVISSMNVKGIPLTELLSGEKINALIERTRHGGAEIVSLLKSGSAYYAPSASAYEMVKAIVLDEKRVLPCAAYLDGQYGASGLYAGVPVLLGSGGVEKVIELKLDEDTGRAFGHSLDSVRSLIAKLKI
jgi:malate dehydrogenase